MKYQAYKYLLEKNETFSGMINFLNKMSIKKKLNLSGADLSDVDLDFSSFPLWCGSFNIKCDDKLVNQLLYHICRLDNNFAKSLSENKTIKDAANKFHGIDEHGLDLIK